MGKSRFIGQAEIEGDVHLARTGALPVTPEAGVFEIRALIHIEIAVDRVERDDPGQQRGVCRAAIDEVPDRHKFAADLAADGGLHLGEFDVELRRFDGGARRLAGFLGLALVGSPRVHFLLGDGARFDQLLSPGEILLGPPIPRDGLF